MASERVDQEIGKILTEGRKGRFNTISTADANARQLLFEPGETGEDMHFHGTEGAQVIGGSFETHEAALQHVERVRMEIESIEVEGKVISERQIDPPLRQLRGGE